MKKTSYIHSLLAFLFLSGGLAACTVDVEEISGEQGQPVTIAIETETRAPGNDPDVTGIHYGDGIDSKIEKVRVLGFRVSNGTLAFNELVDVNAIESDPTNGSVKGTIDVLTGRYDFMFIANEDSDPALAAKLADNTQVASIGLVKNLSFAQSSFSETASIPMVRMVESVLVIGDNTLQSSEGNVDNGVWNVAMKRLGVRVELELDMSDAFAASGVLSFANVPDEVFLVQKENIASTSTRTISLTPTVTSITDGKKLAWPRIILPESWFTDKTDEDNAVEIRMTNAGSVKKAYLGIDPGTDYTMPRNYYFKIVGTVKDSDIDFTLHVIDWNDVANNVNIPKPYTLALVPDVKEFYWWLPPAGGTTVQVQTDYTDEAWTAEIISGAYWMSFGGSATGTGSGTLSLTLADTTPTESDPATWGIGKVKVTLGRISTTVTVARRKPIASLYARSNIVMDNGVLLFATTEAENATVPADAQGLHFKFGSLLGIASNGGNRTGFYPEQIVFNPTTLTFPANGSAEYLDIPFFNYSTAQGASGGAHGYDYDDFINYTPYGGLGYDEALGTGDICRYISDKKWVQGRWRVPTERELEALVLETVNNVRLGTWSGKQVLTDCGDNGKYGFSTINAGALYGAYVLSTDGIINKTVPESGRVFLPVGGLRVGIPEAGNYGAFDNCGQHGHLWSSTDGSGAAENGTNLYYHFGGTNVPQTISGEYATAMRCIRDFDK